MIHIYVRRGVELMPLASCEEDALGFTLRTLREEGQTDGNSRIGILARDDHDEHGTWLINPFAKGRP